MEETNVKKYWLHRIKGVDNAMKLSHPLFFNHAILSTGWAELSYDDFVKSSRNSWTDFVSHFEDAYGYLRNRNCLWRFLNMKVGDVVVVPTWGVFSVFRIIDNNIFTAESISSIISSEEMVDWFGEIANVKDGTLYDSKGKYIDLGFFRKVESIALKLLRQEYANQALYSRMKIMQTNADISDLCQCVEDTIERAQKAHPISIHEELEKSTLSAVQQTINDYVQHYQYEDLVERYLWAIGASEVLRPATNESRTEEGDADRVAYFEELKVAVMVQVKKHNQITNGWAVDQITTYKENHTNEEYSVQLWVISNANEFSEDAKQKARDANVRLINGEDFARMILEVGLKHFRE